MLAETRTCVSFCRGRPRPLDSTTRRGRGRSSADIKRASPCMVSNHTTELTDGWINLPDRSHDVIGVLPCELRVQRDTFKTTEDIDGPRTTARPVTDRFPSFCIERRPGGMDRDLFLDVGNGRQND